MQVQAREEEGHAKKIFDFLVERGGRVALKAIAAPPLEWKSPLAVFEDSYAHEQKVTGLIGKLVDLARAEGDHAAEVFLAWFVTEQVEEEANAQEIVEKLRLIKDFPQGLFMLDSVLAQRE
jgi:ferritin